MNKLAFGEKWKPRNHLTDAYRDEVVRRRLAGQGHKQIARDLDLHVKTVEKICVARGVKKPPSQHPRTVKWREWRDKVAAAPDTTVTERRR